MSRATLFLIPLLVIAAGVDASPVDGEAVVLHAEPPVLSQLARLVPMKARVEVRVGPDGSVMAAEVLEPRPPFVASLSEKAACLWRFSPAPEGVERSYVLTFDYAATVTSEQPTGWRVTREEDSLTLRVQYFQSTIRRLDRDEYAQMRSCPRHRIPMRIGLVPIVYGLPRSYLLDDPAGRAELRKARRVGRAGERLFPEANVDAPGGGCMVQPEAAAEVHYCTECRHAREAWFRSHPGLERYE